MAISGVDSFISFIDYWGVWIKAAGIFVVLWIIFETVALWLNYKRWKDVGNIKGEMKRIESKIDTLLKKRK
jgi:hypothetical protein